MLILIVFSSFAEIISIGAVLPFLAALSSPERLFGSAIALPVVNYFELVKPQQLTLIFTFVFVLSAIFSGFMRLALLYVNTRLSFSAGADLSVDIYRRTLYQSYPVHVARNSSEIISGITKKANSIAANIAIPVLTLISSTIFVLAIVSALILVNPTVALIALVSFGIVYGIIIKATHKKLTENGQKIAVESTSVIKSLQEGLGGIRDVLIDGSQEAFCQIYKQSDYALRRAQGTNKIIAESPRYLIEAIGVALIAVLAYSLTNESEGFVNAIPTLGALAIGAQRLLPAIQQGYASISIIRGAQAALADTLELLAQPLPGYVNLPTASPICFQGEIAFEDLSFRYGSDAPWVLNNVNIQIAKGSRVGIVGATGGGKSTLLDILMGLLEPTKGRLTVDGVSVTPFNSRSWQMRLAHVPQFIYLSDGSIEENIAFGVPIKNIDRERVRAAARQAHLADLIETWPLNYRTLVGENGIRLSGGQRQRIGIARALYKKADVIILDEATSALDTDTEMSIMESINELSGDLTIIIVTHRPSTLRDCNAIYEVKNGGIERQRRDHAIDY